MKKFYSAIAALLLTVNIWAQAPQKMSYQAVIRNASNTLLVNQSVGIRISIIQGTIFGASVYVETHTTTTNANGLISIEIGSGDILNGNFNTINWANGPYFVKTETDPTGGSNYTIVGTNQLLSVPYALHAKTAESISGGLNETDPLFNSSVAKSINANDTVRWNNKLNGYTETDPSFNNSLAKNITANDTIRWNNKLNGYTETDPSFNNSLAKSINSNDTSRWNGKLSSYTETDPSFNNSLAKNITANDTARWNNKLSNYTETDPSFNNSLAKSINSNDTARWNGKLSSYTETDPIFTNSLAKNITAIDTARWNNKLNGYTETDPTFNSSLAKNITANDTAKWNDNHLQLFRVSTLGDTLFMSRANWVIIPGISAANQPTYPAGSVFCASGQTQVVPVLNPITGRTWMDRNLGATRPATNSLDTLAYGDLYQWGRRSDGHQCRNSTTTTSLSSIDQPSHGSFILNYNSPKDWRIPQNANLWQGVNGVNNPCPQGYRLPTETELEAERLSWVSQDAAGAFASPLKLTLAGMRGTYFNGSIAYNGSFGWYWSSTIWGGTMSRYLRFVAATGNAYVIHNNREEAYTVRCIKH
jgi:uncharacterized protein (TIGR02145 family)